MAKRIYVLMVVFLLLFLSVSPLFADRNTSTITGYTASTLIKRGDWKIYRITYIVTAAGGSFTVYDSLTIGAGSNTNVKTEGSEAVDKNGKILDFTDKPLEGSTGLYLVVSNANVVVEYE
jgi:hypothetical protein